MIKGVGQRVRIARREAGLSVRELADKAGLAVSTLYDLERGDQANTTKLPLIAAATGYSATWLQNGVGRPKQQAPAAAGGGGDSRTADNDRLDASVISEILDIIEERRVQNGDPPQSNRTLANVIADNYHAVARERKKQYKKEVARIIAKSLNSEVRGSLADDRPDRQPREIQRD